MTVKPYDEQKMVMTRWDHVKEYGTVTRKCTVCGKRYKLPAFIFEERMKMCATCESSQGAMDKISAFFGGLKL